MTRPAFPLLLAALLGLNACATPKPLPIYEPPLPRAEFQTVRTTAYTHTEDDHLAYGNRNALGGTLRPAPPPMIAPAAPVLPLTLPAGGFRPPPSALRVAAARPISDSGPPSAPTPGSAAADWSRWPAGTVFRVLSTGQIYQVDDYGWALAGRNTLDLYLPTRAAMNTWGVRREPIQILHWGDADESLRLLRPREKYRHIRRMVLELEGRPRAAASLR